MRPTALASVFAASSILLVAAGAMGQGAQPAAPAPRWVGLVTGDPERDSFGYVLDDQAGQHLACSVPRYTRDAGLVGTITGDPEKDSFGHVVLPPSGEDACPGRKAWTR